jgi:hypothetical protein
VRLVFLVTGLCFLRRPTDTIILEPNPPSTQALRRLVGRDSEDAPPSTKPLAFIAVIRWLSGFDCDADFLHRFQIGVG